MLTQDEPLLTRGEQRELGLRARAGDAEAVDELVRRNLRLVLTYARRLRCPRGMQRDDLIQHGIIGLMTAARRFDPAAHPDASFATYAMYWVKQSIKRAIRDEGTIVRIPSHVYDKMAMKRRGERLTDSQERLLGHAHAARTLQDTEESMVAELPAPGNADLAMTHEDVRAAVDRLDPRSRDVIHRRFLADEPQTLLDVGKEYGVTRERVRQIEKKAIGRLRKSLATA